MQAFLFLNISTFHETLHLKIIIIFVNIIIPIYIYERKIKFYLKSFKPLLHLLHLKIIIIEYHNF